MALSQKHQTVVELGELDDTHEQSFVKITYHEDRHMPPHFKVVAKFYRPGDVGWQDAGGVCVCVQACRRAVL